MTMQGVVEVECEACYATGLYSGFMEAEGEAVICHGCNGTGCATLTYTKFTKRRPKRGIKWVRESRGTFIGTGVGPVGGRITYADFKKGKRPRR